MSKHFFVGSVIAVTGILIRTHPALAASPNLQGPADVFLGSPFLILGFIAGLIATGFAFYSASQMRGGKMAPVLNLLGVAILLLDIGVIAVTFFSVNSTTKLIHDLSLLVGFALALIAFSQMRRIVG